MGTAAQNQPATFVRVKGLGNVPVEAFPKNYRVKGKDSVVRSPSEIPLTMVLKVSDNVRDQLIANMKRRNLKLVVDVEIIGGRAFKVEQRGTKTVKTEVSTLPKYAQLEIPTTSGRLLRKERRGYGQSRRTKEIETLMPYQRALLQTAWKTATTPAVADKYKSFAEMAAKEKEGRDYTIESRIGSNSVAIVAVHGGNTEPGTTEMANAIAGDKYSFYSMTSAKALDNADLHVTSSKFDEPVVVGIVKNAATVISIHGAGDKEDAIWIGGRAMQLGYWIKKSLEAYGFIVKEEARFSGLAKSNIVNRGITGAGVQLEISRGLRNKMFADGLKGRTTPTVVFERFVAAIKQVVEARDSYLERVECELLALEVEDSFLAV